MCGTDEHLKDDWIPSIYIRDSPINKLAQNKPEYDKSNSLNTTSLL